MHKYFLGFCVLLCSVFYSTLFGQNASANVQVPSREIFLGDQLTFNCIIIAGTQSQVQAVDLTDALKNAGWELINLSESSSSPIDNRKTQFVIPVTVTAWEEGKKDIPAFTFNINGSTIQSAAVSIDIQAPPSVNEQYIADIKNIVTAEASWLDYLPYVLLVIVIVGIIVALFYVYKLYKSGKIFAKAVALTPEEEALQAAEKLEASTLLSEGNVVEFHTQAAMILRNYIHKRSHIDTLYKPTSYFLPLVQINKYLKACFEEIEEVLDTADALKFAKASALPQAHSFAINTIKNTANSVKQMLQEEQEAALQAASVKNK